MNRGSLFLLSDRTDVRADVSSALAVISVPLEVFGWQELDRLVSRRRTQPPVFVLCDTEGVRLSAAGEEWLRQLTPECVFVVLGEIPEASFPIPFAGAIPLPLEFPASAQLMQRLITECLILSDT